MKNRERLAWTVSLCLITFLAFSLPGSLGNRDDDYSFVRTLVDIHRQVANNYVEPVDETKLHDGAIEGMLGQLDPFTVYIPPQQQEQFDRMLEGSFKGVGIQLDTTPDGKPEVIAPIDGSPAFKAGVQAGDVIEKVNGTSLEGLRLPDVTKKIAGKLGTPVTLTVTHANGDTEDLTMTRDEIVVPTLKGYTRDAHNNWDYYASEDPKIAYVRITQFTPDTTANLRTILTKALSDGMKGLILDLRFNPGGRLDEAVAMIDMLIDHGVIVSTKGRNRPEHIEYATAAGTLPDFPMIVLVNDHSASAAEIVSGSLMDNHRALVIGQRTYGKGSVQEVIPLDSNAGELKLTVAYYYLPSGRLVHRKKGATDWGVEPQISIPLDADGEQRVLEERFNMESFHRPTSKPTSTTLKAVLTTQPADPQLQQALTTMIGLIVLKNDHTPVAGSLASAATSRPLKNIPEPAPDDATPRTKPETRPTTVPQK
ncbi:MAG TPA: S41 family peptidase [Tepidisphaeraceae bacterium]|jgi:carboxyl-terminal processing protease|nr:S41 family peptidase [Tepidisphaeraceae bacterium]